eukprot:TRINITY_DN89815_c0_g1_i1.p1 TRINITY_DN89815_c0_g1~~TRINITY_DN89815_c0_g1_i1.p1  ORF type:complete len:285 (+),score=16.80 TRINITY_DN89815_c0_g1_i1:487-1341(+)
MYKQIQKSQYYFLLEQCQMTKVFCVLLICLAFVNCEDHYFIYDDGKMKRDKEEDEKDIFGSMTISDNQIDIDGLYEDNMKLPFSLVFDMQSSTQQGDQVTLKGHCKKAYWDGIAPHKIEGEYSITGLWANPEFKGNCRRPGSSLVYDLHLKATKYDCKIYKAEDAAKRAQFLVGRLKEHFSAAEVLNFAYYDYPYAKPRKDCSYYLNNFGEETTDRKPGYAIVSKYGNHCAIIDKEGDKFIHANPTGKKVVATPISMIDNFFRSEYVIKTVPCKDSSLTWAQLI